ncbi:MAG: SgcJ/EcaC family oxidoreductase [candidate division Zixibacteria bacterium]
MRIQTSAAILIVVALIFSACQPCEEQTVADVEAIRALTQQWNAAVEAQDVPALVALYADDIVQMPPNAPFNRGKQAIEEYYSGGLEQLSIEMTWPVEGTEEIIVADGWAFHISEYFGTYTP